YRENKRELPWRETGDPYRIWISEVILQQTRVAQGYEYYVRFIERFPDYSTLAAAPEDEVMRYWQGLGYYSRARNLHQAAKSIGDSFPADYNSVRALKGVGEYTAAAICSIAYDLPHAVVDGNVYRVLARYYGIDLPIDSTEGKKYFKELADRLMDPEYPGEYNQAIMDFGALQCVPQSPKCLFCPLTEGCVALQQGTVARLPVKQHKTKVTDRFFNYLFIHDGEYTYLRKRVQEDIWKNLYEFPLVETPGEITPEELFHLKEYRELFGSAEPPLPVPVLSGVRHVLSHRIIHTVFYEVVLPASADIREEFIKIKREEIEQYPVSRLMKIFLEKNN
ncbi:MAG: A/G-specific adenine glycosylase, partial [Bacteroides sp.]|nr:A/G-specific adenine glycosylase [Bacteroides sp.]